MWYFSWVLGLGLAATFAILNAMWFEINEYNSGAITTKPRNNDSDADKRSENLCALSPSNIEQNHSDKSSAKKLVAESEKPAASDVKKKKSAPSKKKSVV